jgi:hypothetical protein
MLEVADGAGAALLVLVGFSIGARLSEMAIYSNSPEFLFNIDHLSSEDCCIIDNHQGREARSQI